MKIIQNTYQHVQAGFKIKVETCNKRIATTKNLETNEIVKFNRNKLEWMINKNIFKELSNE